MTGEPAQTSGKSAFVRMFLISFAALFFEILMIRWIASEIRIFGYFKNLILIACVVGMGLGCALSGRDSKDDEQAGPWFPVFMVAIAGILALAAPLSLTHMSFIFTLDLFVWDQFVPSATAFLRNICVMLGVFLLVVATFDFLGREMGRELSKLPPLKGYSANLLGSLAGVVAYSLLSYLETPPTVWLALGFAALLPFWRKPQHIALFAATIALAFVVSNGSIWSPYYRIDISPFFLKDTTGGALNPADKLGDKLDANHDYHQKTLDFSRAFMEKHPDLVAKPEFQTYYKSYNLPYEAVPHPDHVLVLGAGSGNDVAAALRYGAKHVDAVEIDPTILSLGEKIHPEKPYSDSRVVRHCNDARNYLAEDKHLYDLIVFGHVDSLTAFSSLSSVRLDNFLYTKESIKNVTEHLSKDGIGALSFASGPAWLRARLYQVVKQASGYDPLVLRTNFDNKGSVIIFWGPGLALVKDSLVAAHKDELEPIAELSSAVEVPSDDWPFLYQEKRNLPPVYLGMLLVVFLLSSLVVSVRFRLKPDSLMANSRFFFLGAGFLLLETRGMLAVSILLGSTWVVSSFVIGTVLAMGLLANTMVSRLEKLSIKLLYTCLFAALALLYFFHLGSLVGQPYPVRLLASILIIGAPFFFSGAVFSKAFSQAKNPSQALGINILGALLGGCTEYLSMAIGTNALVLLAMVFYLLSMLEFKKGEVKEA